MGRISFNPTEGLDGLGRVRVFQVTPDCAFVSAREQRVTGVMVFILTGISVFLAPILKVRLCPITPKVQAPPAYRL